MSGYGTALAARRHRLGGQPLRLRGTWTTIPGILLTMACGGAFADETTSLGASNAEIPSNSSEPAPGACLPIGVTASGEVVFPLLCKSFLERNKGGAAAAAEQKPAPEERPATTDNQAGERSDQIVVHQPEASPSESAGGAPSPTETVSSIKSPGILSKPARSTKKHLRHMSRTKGSRGCMHYRTFDPNSETYRDYSGRRRMCRS